VIWKRIYGPDGPLNEALRAVGLGDLAKNWLGDFTWALPSLGVIGTWTALGLCMVLFVAGSRPSRPSCTRRRGSTAPVRSASSSRSRSRASAARSRSRSR
jgi:ABC-type sugar transport systems, permease components